MKISLKLDGNLTTNWKKFRRAWNNYAIVARLDKFMEAYKIALLLSIIGEDAVEVFEAMHFEVGTIAGGRCNLLRSILQIPLAAAIPNES